MILWLGVTLDTDHWHHRLGVEVSTNHGLAISLCLPRVELYLFTDRRPMLSIEYAPGCSAGPVWMWRNRDAVRRHRRERQAS